MVERERCWLDGRKVRQREGCELHGSLGRVLVVERVRSETSERAGGMRADLVENGQNGPQLVFGVESFYSVQRSTMDRRGDWSVPHDFYLFTEQAEFWREESEEMNPHTELGPLPR